MMASPPCSWIMAMERFMECQGRMRFVSQRPTRCPLRVLTSSPTTTSMGSPRPSAMARAATAASMRS